MRSDWDRIEDDWHAYRDLAHKKWPRIEPTILAMTGGRRDALVDAVERAYDVSRDQARREVTYWMTVAPMERAAEADRIRRTKRFDRTRFGQRLTGQRYPDIDTRPDDEEGWMDTVRSAGRMPVRQARQHPIGAMMLAVGLGLIAVQLAGRGR